MPSASHFTDDSMIRTVHREVAVSFGGPRALLLMAAHPVAFEGFFASTSALDEPYERLRRVAVVLDEITWGRRDRANAMCRRVRAVHARATGRLPATAGRFPAGTTYRADDPELLLWILASLVESSLLAYERLVRPLTPDERDRAWHDYRLMGRLFGLRAADMPRTHDDFAAYMQAMYASGDLVVTPSARETGRRIVLRPPVPLYARGLLELSNAITVGTLPAAIRRQYGLRWDPLRGVALAGGMEYARRVVVPLLPGRLRLVRAARV